METEASFHSLDHSGKPVEQSNHSAVIRSPSGKFKTVDLTPRKYVQRVRSLLHNACLGEEACAFCRPQGVACRALLHTMCQTDTTSSRYISMSEMQQREQLERRYLKQCAVLSIQEVSKPYESCTKTHTFTPWCTKQCLYCCESRETWSHRYEEHLERCTSLLVLEESLQRERIVVMEEPETLRNARQVLDRETCALSWALHNQNLLFCVEARQREAQIMEETVSFHKDINVPYLHHKVFEGSIQRYREQYENSELALHRREIEVEVREARLAAQYRRILITDEQIQRQKIDQEYLTEITALYGGVIRSVREYSEEAWRVQNHVLADERDALVADRQRQLDLQQESERLRCEQNQTDLEAEYAALKRLQPSRGGSGSSAKKPMPSAGKKAGGSRSGLSGESLPFPPCARCHGLISNGDLTTHRLMECPWRPSECAQCGAIVSTHALEHHITNLCSQRTQACQQCGKLYLSVYVAQHEASCSLIQEARERISPCSATLPFTLREVRLSSNENAKKEQGGARLGAENKKSNKSGKKEPPVGKNTVDDQAPHFLIIDTLETDSEMYRTGIRSGDRLVFLEPLHQGSRSEDDSVCEQRVLSVSEIQSVLQTLQIGVTYRITLHVQPNLEVLQTATIAQSVNWTVETTISIEAYREAHARVVLDESNQRGGTMGASRPHSRSLNVPTDGGGKKASSPTKGALNVKSKGKVK